MVKRSWQSHQHRVTLSCLEFNRACRLGSQCWSYYPVFDNSIGHVTRPPLLKLSSLHQVVAVIVHTYSMSDEIYGCPLLLDANILAQYSKYEYHIYILPGNTCFFFFLFFFFFVFFFFFGGGRGWWCLFVCWLVGFFVCLFFFFFFWGGGWKQVHILLDLWNVGFDRLRNTAISHYQHQFFSNSVSRKHA